LKLSEDQVTLEVEDNGNGFVLPRRWIDLARKGHLGLVGATERAEALGGHLVINSAPGKGTDIQAIVPFH
jgi:signal transduction histidine kinase